MRTGGLTIVLLLLACATLAAETLPAPQQALAEAFPGATFSRETIFLSPEQVEHVTDTSGGVEPRELVFRYVATQNGVVVGYGYFDSHRVRTLMETVLIALTATGEISRIEVVAFNEPMDYFPKRRWLDQFRGQRLDRDLSLRGAIRPISGATLTGRAILDASRKVLALHQTLQARQ